MSFPSDINLIAHAVYDIQFMQDGMYYDEILRQAKRFDIRDGLHELVDKIVEKTERSCYFWIEIDKKSIGVTGSGPFFKYDIELLIGKLNGKVDNLPWVRSNSGLCSSRV